jgi:hypothetical protein
MIQIPVCLTQTQSHITEMMESSIILTDIPHHWDDEDELGNPNFSYWRLNQWENHITEMIENSIILTDIAHNWDDEEELGNPNFSHLTVKAMGVVNRQAIGVERGHARWSPFFASGWWLHKELDDGGVLVIPARRHALKRCLAMEQVNVDLGREKG